MIKKVIFCFFQFFQTTTTTTTKTPKNKNKNYNRRDYG